MAAHVTTSPDARQAIKPLPSSGASNSSDDEHHGGSLLLSMLDMPLPPGTKELSFGNHVPAMDRDALTASFGFPAVPPRMRDSLTGGLKAARRSRQYSSGGGSPPPDYMSFSRNAQGATGSAVRRKRTSSSRGSIISSVSPKKGDAKKLASPPAPASRLASPRTHPPKLYSPKSVDAGLRNIAAASGRVAPSGGARVRGASSVDAAVGGDVFPGGLVKEVELQPALNLVSQPMPPSSDAAEPSSDSATGPPSSLGLSWSSSQASSAPGPATSDDDEEGMEGLTASSEGADSSGAPVTPATPGGASSGGWTPRELTLGSTQSSVTDRERERERMLIGLGIRSANRTAATSTASDPQTPPWQLQTSGLATAQRRPPREMQPSFALPSGPSPNVRTGGPRQLMLAPAGGPPGSNRTIAVTDAREIPDARSARDPLRVSPRIPLASRSASAGPSSSGPSPLLAPRSPLPVFQAPPLPSPLLGLGLRSRRGSSSLSGSVSSLGVSMGGLAAPAHAYSDGSISPVASAPSWEMTRGTSSTASGSVRGPSPAPPESIAATSSSRESAADVLKGGEAPLIQEPEPYEPGPATHDTASDATPSLTATPSPSAARRVSELQTEEGWYDRTSRPIQQLARAGSFGETAFGRRPSTTRLAKAPPTPLNLARTPSTRSEASRGNVGLGVNLLDSPRSEGPSEMSDAPEPVTAMMGEGFEGDGFELVAPGARNDSLPTSSLLAVAPAPAAGNGSSSLLAPPSPHSATSSLTASSPRGSDGFHTPAQSPASQGVSVSASGSALEPPAMAPPEVEITAFSPTSDIHATAGSDVSSQRTPQQATSGLLGSPPQEALPEPPATAYFDFDEEPQAESNAEPLLFRAAVAQAPATEASSEASGPTSASVIGSTDSPARRFLGSVARDSTSSRGAFEFDEGGADDADAALRRPSSTPSGQHPLSASHTSLSSTRSSLFSQDSVLDQAADGSGLTDGLRSPDGEAKQTSADTSLGMSPSPSMQFNTAIFSGMTTSASKEDGIGPKNSWPPPPRDQMFPGFTPLADAGAGPVVPARGSSAGRSRSGRSSAASNYARSSVVESQTHSRAASRTGEDLSRQSSRLSGVDEDKASSPGTPGTLAPDRALTSSPTRLSFTAPLPQEEWVRPPIKQRTSSQNLRRHVRSTSNLARDAAPNTASSSATSSPIARSRSKPSLKVDTARRPSDVSEFAEPISARPRPSLVPDVPVFGYAPSTRSTHSVRTSSSMAPPPMSATSSAFPSDDFGGMSSRWSSGSESDGEGPSSKAKAKSASAAAAAKGKGTAKRGRSSNTIVPAMPATPGGSIGRKSGGFLSGLGLRKKSFTSNVAAASAAGSHRSNSPMTPGTGPTSPSIATEAYTEFPFPGFAAVGGGASEGSGGLGSAPDTPHSAQLASRFSQSTTYSYAPSAKPSTSSLRNQFLSGEASRRPSVSAASVAASDSPAASSPVRPVASAMGPPELPQQHDAAALANLQGLGIAVNDAQRGAPPAPPSKEDGGFVRGHVTTASTSSLRRRWEQHTGGVTVEAPLTDSRRPSRVDAPLPPPPAPSRPAPAAETSSPMPTADSSATLIAKPAARATTPPIAAAKLDPPIEITASTPQRAPSLSLSDETPRVAYASLPGSEASSPTTAMHPRESRRAEDEDDGDDDDGLEALGLSFIQRQASLRQPPARPPVRIVAASPSEFSSSPSTTADSLISAMPMPPARAPVADVAAPAGPPAPLRRAHYNSLSDIGRAWVSEHPGKPLLAAKGPELRQAATASHRSTAANGGRASESDSGTDDYGSSDGGGGDEGGREQSSQRGSASGGGRGNDGDDSDSDRQHGSGQPFNSGFDEEDDDGEEDSDDYGSEDEQLCSDADAIRSQQMARSGTSSASDDAPLGGRVSDVEALQRRLREQERKAQVAHTASRLESGARRQTDPSRTATRKQRLPKLVQEAAPDSSPLNALDLIARLEKLAVQQKQKEHQARALAQSQAAHRNLKASNAAASAVPEGRTSSESQRSAVSSYQQHASDSSHRPRQGQPLRQATVPAAMAHQALSRARSLKQPAVPAAVPSPVNMSASSSAATDPREALRRQASSESLAKAAARGVYQPGGQASFQPPMAAMMIPKRSPVLPSDSELPLGRLPASPAVSSAMAMMTAQADAYEQARLNAEMPGMNAAAAAAAAASSSAAAGGIARPRWPNIRAPQVATSSPLASSSDDSFVSAQLTLSNPPAQGLPANILPRSRARSNSRPRAPTLDTRVAPPMPTNAATTAAAAVQQAPAVAPLSHSPAVSLDSSTQHVGVSPAAAAAAMARRSPQAAFNDLPSAGQAASAVPAPSATTQLVQHRVYVNSLQKYGTALLPFQARARDLVTDVLDKGLVPQHEQQAGGWVVFDVCAELGIERPIREYEIISEVVEARASSSDYFMLKRTELAPYLSFRAVPSSSPVLAGYVYVQDAKKKWSKRWLELREHSLFHAKSEKGKDEQLICHLSGFDVYLVDQAKVKTPKAHSFAIRSQNKITMFEKPDQDYVHMFSLSDPAAHRDWVRAIMNARTYVLSRERAQLLNYRPRPAQASSQAMPAVAPQMAAPTQTLIEAATAMRQTPSNGSSSLSRVNSGRRMPPRSVPAMPSDDAGVAAAAAAASRSVSGASPLVDTAVVGPFAKGSLLADVAARNAPEMDLSLHERTRARMQAAARKAMMQEQERRARADGQPLLDMRR